MNTVVHILWKVVWLIAIFALLSIGLMPLGINIYKYDFMMNNPWLVSVIQWVALIAGVLGLVKFIRSCMGGGHSWCGCGSNYNGSNNSGMRKNCPGCGMANCNCR